MIPRRMLGFGFALFLMLVILAVIYSQYAMRHQPSSSDEMARPKSAVRVGDSTASDGMSSVPLPVVINSDTVTSDLIDEAVADGDLSAFVEDELADVEDGK